MRETCEQPCLTTSTLLQRRGAAARDAAAYSFAAPLLVSARRRGKERGKLEGGKEGRKEGEKDYGRTRRSWELLGEGISCKSQAEVRGAGGREPSAIIDCCSAAASSVEHERKMRVSFISGDHNWREKWAEEVSAAAAAAARVSE